MSLDLKVTASADRLRQTMEIITQRTWEKRAEPFKMLDHVYCIATQFASQYLIETSEGLVMLDAGWNEMAPFTIDSIHRLGFDPKDIKHLFLTHGHFDHIGGVRVIQEISHCKTYMPPDDMFFLDERRDLGVEWSHNEKDYSLSFGIDYSDVYMCTYSHPYGSIRLSLSDRDYIAAYHTTDDAVLRGIASQLEELGSGMGRTEFAAFVLSFVQSIPYLDDQSSTGSRDYWKYPLETLWDKGGDCEDKTILCDTLLMICGYDVAFLLFQDHAMMAVAVDADGHSVTSDDGTRYVFCETTGPFDIGRTSDGHEESDIYYWCPVTVDGN